MMWGLGVKLSFHSRGFVEGLRFSRLQSWKSWKSFNPENPDSDKKKNLKPPHRPQRFIPNHNCRRSTPQPVFTTQTQKTGDTCEFFHKKGLTDNWICCIIGRLLIYRGEIMSTFRRAANPAETRKRHNLHCFNFTRKDSYFYDTRERRFDTVWRASC